MRYNLLQLYIISFCILIAATSCLHPVKLSLNELSGDQAVRADSLGTAGGLVKIEPVSGREFRAKHLVVGRDSTSWHEVKSGDTRVVPSREVAAFAFRDHGQGVHDGFSWGYGIGAGTGTLVALASTGEGKESFLFGVAFGLITGLSGVVIGGATGAEMRYDLWSGNQPHRKAALPRNKLESTYCLIGLGRTHYELPGRLGPVLEKYRESDSEFGVEVMTDLLMIYRPAGENLLLGGGLRLLQTAQGEETVGSVGVRAIMPSAGSLFFVSNRAGQGLFLRGDLGLSFLKVSGEDVADPVIDGADASGIGCNIMVGIGFGVPVNPGTRLLAGASTGFQSSAGKTDGFGVTVLSLGVLF
jgi:hypothetical protein